MSFPTKQEEITLIAFLKQAKACLTLLFGRQRMCEVSRTYFEGLVVNTLGADVVMAAVDQGHGVREAGQL